MRSSKTYDGLERLTSIRHQRLIGDQAVMASYAGPAGTTQQSNTASHQQIAFARNRLIQMEADVNAGGTVPSGDLPRQRFTFAYDHIGRRTTKEVYAWDAEMFFPESCEYAKYWYGSGTVRGDKVGDALEEDKNRILNYLKAAPVGLNFGISGEFVSARPISSIRHNARSWLGWFWTGSAALPTGFLVGLGLSGFFSPDWLGYGFGASVGPPGGDASALFFTAYAENNGKWVPGSTYYDFSDEPCFCAALRVLSADQSDALMYLLSLALNNE